MLHFLWYDGYPLFENSYSIYESSNKEIAKWAEYYLSQKTSFHQSECSSGRVTDNPNDILIGHLTWCVKNQVSESIYGKFLRNWVKDNAIHPDQSSHPNTYILTPWVPDFPIEWVPHMPWLEFQLLQAKKIFALCGEIWIERTLAKYDNSIQSRVKEKLVHCNMGIAAKNFNVYKKKFNKIGSREILHVSNLGAYKGFEVTCKSLMNLDTILHLASFHLKLPIGMNRCDIDGEEFFFRFMGSIDNSDPKINAMIVDTCDFYIHTATMDAQATTILENCARGLIPLITPESGFSSPYAIYLTHDPTENRKIIDWALNLPEEELLIRSHLLREQIFRDHSWEIIFDKIWNEINQDINARKLLSNI